MSMQERLMVDIKVTKISEPAVTSELLNDECKLDFFLSVLFQAT